MKKQAHLMRWTIMYQFLFCVCQFIRQLKLFFYKVRNGRNSHKVMFAYSPTYLQDSATLQRLASKLAVHGNQALMLSCIRLIK